MIVNFKSTKLELLWTTGDVSLLPQSLVYEVIDILDELDDAVCKADLENLGAYQFDKLSQPDAWAVTYTVNNVEPVGSITCVFKLGDIFDVDINQYD